MKKASILVIDRHREAALTALRKVGVVHVERREMSGASISALNEERGYLERAIRLLPPEPSDPGKSPRPEPRVAARQVIEAYDAVRNCREEIDRIRKEKERLIPWGEFDPDSLRELADRGVAIRLYELPIKAYGGLADVSGLFVLDTGKTVIRVAAVRRTLDAEGAVELEIPDKGISRLTEDERNAEERLETLESDLGALSRYRTLLTNAVESLDREIEFESVKDGMESAKVISVLSGFVPVTKLGNLKNAAASNGWGLFLRDPDPDDTVPSLVKTSRAVGIIKPIFDLIGTVPGYGEFDISLPFLIFFTIFFAMIIGDAGYGLVFLAGSLYFLGKSAAAGKPIPKIVSLMTLMSTATVAWGAVTGTWFGSAYLAELPFLNALTIPRLSSFDPASSLTIKWLCFIIGTVQIGIACIWSFIRAVKEKPFIRSLSQLGWLSAVLGLYYVVLNIVLSAERFPIPPYALYMIGGGIGAVILFSQQEGNFLKGVLKGLSGFLPTFLSSIGAFSDIVSYIRLFAVGLASIEIAKAFNAMAADMGNQVFGIVAGAVVLLIGHSLNLAMGALSVIVHGVRLNMLEFSGHLGMEWTGVEYRPFGNEGATDQ